MRRVRMYQRVMPPWLSYALATVLAVSAAVAQTTSHPDIALRCLGGAIGLAIGGLLSQTVFPSPQVSTRRLFPFLETARWAGRFVFCGVLSGLSGLVLLPFDAVLSQMLFVVAGVFLLLAWISSSHQRSKIGPD